MHRRRQPSSLFQSPLTRDVAKSPYSSSGKNRFSFKGSILRGNNTSSIMYKKRKLSQNFLWNRELVKKLVESSSIGKNDLVIEIGPGDGIILNELAENAGKVIGVEIDYDMFARLKQRHTHETNIELFLGDALSFPVPRGPYKVFSNIPFAIEGKLTRKFLNEHNPPTDCFLIVRKDLAERLIKKNTQFHSQHSPFFEFSIFHYFRHDDFSPKPKVGIAMLRFKIRQKPLLHLEERKKYQEFISMAFGNGGPVHYNLRKRLSKHTLIRMQIGRHTGPKEISLERWIDLFKRSESQKKLMH
ncbi:MAG TPA: rRNA adenine dimethyltransferase family protein [Patescibacteria group bacterium]|nr:rRNA adenine dimethyltransferase family protein [Patescibacteria group bacterium]